MRKMIEHLDEDRFYILYEGACAYRKIFYLSFNELLTLDSESLPILPATVNGILSIELFLKYLTVCESRDPATQEGVFTHSHNLFQLFQDLPTHRKEKIGKRLGEKALTIEDVVDYLKKHPNDFVEFRYATQEEEYYPDWSIMVVLAEVLYEEASTIANQFVTNENNELTGLYPRKNVSIRAKLSDKALEILESQDYYCPKCME